MLTATITAVGFTLSTVKGTTPTIEARNNQAFDASYPGRLMPLPPRPIPPLVMTLKDQKPDGLLSLQIPPLELYQSLAKPTPSATPETLASQVGQVLNRFNVHFDWHQRPIVSYKFRLDSEKDEHPTSSPPSR